jgi:hypothetical protein
MQEGYSCSMARVRRPASLLAGAALLTALIVQPGDVGSIDTVRRLQTAHSFWTSAPPVVFESDYPVFGLVGRNGRIYAWYGMGQSVLMLPFDIIATKLIHLTGGDARNEEKESVLRRVIVSYMTSTLVCILAILACFRFLRLLEFSTAQAVAGCLTLLFGTTFLHYTQNLAENNYMLLLTLVGSVFHLEWAKNGSKRALLYGCLAYGANLLNRLPTALDWAGGLLFLFLYF